MGWAQWKKRAKHLCSSPRGPPAPHRLNPGSPPLALGVLGLAEVAAVVEVAVEELRELSAEAPACNNRRKNSVYLEVNFALWTHLRVS